MPIEITKNNFEAEVLQADKPVLVDFWAAWCGPCKILSPVVDQIAEEYSDIKVGKVNVDDEPELASQFGVMSIPTLLVFNQGKLIDTSVGVKNKDFIVSMCRKPLMDAMAEAVEEHANASLE